MTMCSLKRMKRLSFTVAALAVVAYAIYKPLPACLDDIPLNVRVIFRVFPITRQAGLLFEKMGIASHVQVLRAMLSMSAVKQADTPTMRTLDADFDGVPVRVYLPTNHQSNGPALMYIHGGGWIMGSVNGSDKFVRMVAEQLSLVSVSVEYRLAPEWPYPAAMDDLERAFRHFAKLAAHYNVDASRIAVAGDSAGGNLAAALTIRLRDSAASAPASNNSAKKMDGRANDDLRVLPKLQVLFYPFLQVVNFSTVSYLRFDDGYVLLRSEVTRSVLMYALGMDYYNATLRSLSGQYLEQACYQLKYTVAQRAYIDGEKRDIRERILSNSDRAFLSVLNEHKRELLNPTCRITDQSILDELHSRMESVFLPDFSPLLSESLLKVPPAYIVSCGHDLVRDDAFLFVERLRDAGIRVEHNHQPKECHGYYTFKPEVAVAHLREFLSTTALL